MAIDRAARQRAQNRSSCPSPRGRRTKKTRNPHAASFTLAVLVLCPVITATLFFLPLYPLIVAFALISLAYLIAFRSDEQNGVSRVKETTSDYLNVLRPAVVYFVMLYIPSVIISHEFSPIPYPLSFCLAIAASSLVCRAAYTLTTDLERREALDDAECAVRKAVFAICRRKKSNRYPFSECTISPALAMMMSFIPLVRRAWDEVDEARRNRAVPFVSASMLSALISTCMFKAIEMQESLEARYE